MNNSLWHCLAGLALMVALIASPALAQYNDSNTADQQADIVETAIQAGGFNTLVKALKAANLVSTLKGEGPFTVFAPTDEAFAALPDQQLQNLLKPENRDQLAKILTYHVVPGEVMASEVIGLDEAQTVAGPAINIQVQDGKVMLMGQNTATVIRTDIQASNGVIHVIDTVLLPPSTSSAMK